MISVVIPLYNKEKLIGKTLRSVLDQTYQDFEIVVVNDGSTDNSVAEVEKIADSRIRLIHQQNAGVSAARNKGITEAKGEFVAFLDADDEWGKSFLSTMVQLGVIYKNCDVLASSYVNHYQDGFVENITINKIRFNGVYGVLDNYFEVAACSHPPIWSSAILVRKSAFIEIGGFPIGIKSGEDLLTWAALALKFKIAYCLTPLAIYNINVNSVGRDVVTRMQDENDPVGVELNRMLRENPKVIGLNNYLSFWYQMRASVAVRIDNQRETLKECRLGLKYNLLNKKLYCFALLAVLPSWLRTTIISKYR